jgi:hypothetical protein
MLNRDAPNGVSSGDMRNFALCGLALVLATATTAAADDDVNGSYSLKFEQVSTNCAPQQTLAFAQYMPVKVSTKGSDIQVDIESIPLMTGKPSKPGKLNVKSRLGHTRLEGMDGVFSLAGRISTEGMASLVLVGEYSASGKPLCTQSWNLTGSKDAGGAAKGKH